MRPLRPEGEVFGTRRLGGLMTRGSVLDTTHRADPQARVHMRRGSARVVTVQLQLPPRRAKTQHFSYAQPG